MVSLHSLPKAFSIVECERIIASIASAPTDEALLVGKNRDQNQRRAELVGVDNVDGLSWVMDRLIDLVRKSNRDQFDFDLRDFAESPQVARGIDRMTSS